MDHNDVEYQTGLADYDWPDDAIFIADAALPAAIIETLPGPIIEVRGGEGLKRLDQIRSLAESVLSIRSTRPMTLVGVGGGSIGDVVGFLASILWRGVGLWHLPTTLLAMVDSAHGGKTAVNLGGRKNQLGTFYPADRVIICTEFLETLPLDLRDQGLVELLKVLWLARPDALASFDDHRLHHHITTGEIGDRHDIWSPLLKAAIQAKYEIVSRDPREQTGHRRILNLGHTAGHGLEGLYGLAHGRAVAWGLAACADLSHRHAGLDADGRHRLLDHVEPLLTPLPSTCGEADRRAFCDLLRHDKKRDDGAVVSILLDAPGEPLQTRALTADDWWQATRRVHRQWRNRSVVLHGSPPVASRNAELPASKSHANRAETIALLREGPTEVVVPPGRLPDDVVSLRRAADRIESTDPEAPLELDVGDGGTTGRFLMAVAACRTGPTTLQFGNGLRQRPHKPLVEALRDAGAEITETKTGWHIVGWSSFPDEIIVDARLSSQFASAIALLSATGTDLRLRLDGPVASRPYFEMTLRMLQDAGVEIHRAHSGVLTFSSTPKLMRPHTVEVPTDTSASVVWHALHALDDRIPRVSLADTSHPDAVFPEFADKLTDATEDTVVADLSDAPDLAPVLAALACRVPPALQITEAPHLRHKESDRIQQLCESFREVGIEIRPRSDGLVVPTGIQSIASDSVFDPRDDHRLAMAAVVLSHPADNFVINNAGCVHKSYPDLWRQMRRAGWCLRRAGPE